MESDWLQQYLNDAVRRELCTRIYCTTCGAREFRTGLLRAWSEATGSSLASGISRETSLALAQELAGLVPDGREAAALESAVRCVLFDLWTGMPVFDQEIEQRVHGTWAGEVLASMRAHHRAKLEAQRASDEYAAKAGERRAEKARLKQERHRERLERKKGIDAAWWARQRPERGAGRPQPLEGRPPADFWVKVVEMLQQNWALLEMRPAGRVDLFFIDDAGGVFDEIHCDDEVRAISALRRNGFVPFVEEKRLHAFLQPPAGPYVQTTHPNGRIYSSGRFFR